MLCLLALKTHCTVIRLHSEKNCTVLRINNLLRARPPFANVDAERADAAAPVARPTGSIEAFALFADRRPIVAAAAHALRNSGFDVPAAGNEADFGSSSSCEERADCDDAAHMQLVFPAILWLPTHNAFLVTVRVFWRDVASVAYGQLFTPHFEPVTTMQRVFGVMLPGILPIPTASRIGRYNGPEDGRLFHDGAGRVLFLFNMKDVDERRKMWLFHFETARTHPIVIADYFWRQKRAAATSTLKQAIKMSMMKPEESSDEEFMPSAEKNWTPLVTRDGTVHMLYNYKNLQLLTCSATLDVCRQTAGGTFDPMPGGLRGGTPFVRWAETDFYVSFAYTHLPHASTASSNRRRQSALFFEWDADVPCDVYRPALIVVRAVANVGAKTSFEVVYASEPVDIWRVAGVRRNATLSEVCGAARIVTIGGLTTASLGDDDVAVVAVNVGDDMPLLLRVTGLRIVVDRVIKAHTHRWLQSGVQCAERLARA